MKIHDKEEVLLIMKTPPQLHYKWICTLTSHPLKYCLFCEGMLQLLVGQNMSLGDCLQGIQIRRSFMPNKQHFASTSLAKHPHHFEIVNDDLSRRLFRLTLTRVLLSHLQRRRLVL